MFAEVLKEKTHFVLVMKLEMGMPIGIDPAYQNLQAGVLAITLGILVKFESWKFGTLGIKH